MSLFCKLFKHKWNVFVQTGSRIGHQNIPSGFGVNMVDQVAIPTGHIHEYEFCKRCGEPNPNYKEAETK